MIEFGKMSNKAKLEFATSALEDESISLHYNFLLAASLLSQEDVQRLKNCIIEGY